MGLDELRAELGSIDRQIFELVGRRQQLSSEIGKTKRTAGRSTRDYRQEKQVIERGRRAAEDIGFSPDLAEQLLLLFIQSSLTVQEKDKVVAEGEGSGKRALVIGGHGKMGGWFVRFLASQGYGVEVADPGGAVEGHTHFANWQDADLQHDVIVVAAPLGASNEILGKLAELKPPGLVFDIGSLKSPLRSGLQALAAAGVKVTSVHPMFGPDTELLSGCHVIFVDLGAQGAVEEAKDLFGSTMAVQVSMDLESHDRSIAYVLGLSHAINIAFFTALAESGEAAPKLAEISSTTFEDQLQVASKVAAENPALYFEIQNLNDYGTESLSALLHAVERLRSIVRSGDESAFVKLMEQGRAYLSGRRDP